MKIMKWKNINYDIEIDGYCSENEFPRWYQWNNNEI